MQKLKFQSRQEIMGEDKYKASLGILMLVVSLKWNFLRLEHLVNR